jgi:DNA gyrase/topoisomerase IV subunit B
MTTWKEHIRKRPGMYIGDLRLTGFKLMVEYIFEELVEDGLLNPNFEIKFYKNCRIEITINKVNVQKTISRINDLHLNSEKLNSFGFAVLISLSEKIKIIANDSLNEFTLYGKNGDYEISQTKTTNKKNEILIDFTLDRGIFKDFEIVYDQLNIFLRQFAYLNPTLKIISIDKSSEDEQKNVYCYQKGIFSQLDYLILKQDYYNTIARIDIDTKVDDFLVKIGICYSSIRFQKSIIKTFANNIETYLGGSFNNGIINGLILAIKQHAEKENIKISITKNSVIDQLILVAAVRGNDLVFSGSVKRKLGMPSFQKKIKELVFNEMTKYFLDKPQIAGHILAKFEIEDDYD